MACAAGGRVLRTITSANTDTGAPCIDGHPSNSRFKVVENEAERRSPVLRFRAGRAVEVGLAPRQPGSGACAMNW